MDIFLDTACLQEIEQALPTGLISGITTNPSLLSYQKKDPLPLLKEICKLVSGPISIEVTEENLEDMLNQAKVFLQLGPQVVIKVPLTVEGLKACHVLSRQGVKVNVTLCFSVTQALLAAKAGATYISPFVGRVDDSGASGKMLLSDIVSLYQTYQFPTRVLAASLRHPGHVKEACQAKAHIMTLPPSLFFQLYAHPLTSQGLETFNRDWKKLLE